MRNILAGVGIAAIAVGIALFSQEPSTMPTPASGGSSEAVSVPFEEIAHGMHSTVSKRVSYLVTSDTGLLALWAVIDAPGQTPKVDFSKNSVIAVFSGNQPTAGYDIKVSHIEDTQSRMVTVQLIKPGSSCILTHSVTSPYQIIKVSNTELTLGHQDQPDTISCLQ
jgi:hypothetical protein